MKSVHCGEKATQKMEFKNFKKSQGDTQALVVLTRDPDDAVQSFVLDVKNGEVETKWPDLEKGADDYHGYAKVMMDGKGTWKERFDRQIYFFDVIVGNDSKRSDTIMIDPLPSKGKVTKSPGVPIVQHNRNLGAIMGMFGFQKIPKALDPNPYTAAAFPMGRFDIAFENGEVLITIAVKINSTSPKIPGDIFKRFKEKVEGFWNGPNGFGRYLFHWKDCKRKADCNCEVAYDRSQNVVDGGCCKIPVRLLIEDSGRHGLTFDMHKVGFFSRYSAGAYAPIPGGGHGYINFPESTANTWAHEIGHCMGLPDQYLGGHNWQPLGKWKNKSKSIMGGGQSRAYEEHLHHAEEFIGKDFEIIEQVSSRP